MIDYKNLTDSVLLSIIDSYEPNEKEFKEFKELAKNDPEFRARLVELQLKNKQDQIENSTSTVEIFEKAISEAPEDIKPKIQESLDRLKKITNWK